MLVSYLGILGSVIGIVYGLYFANIYFFMFFTNWCMIIHLITFVQIVIGNAKSEFTRKLLIVSWSLGWVVTIMFWIYVYPLFTGPLPPMWNLILCHGLIHLGIVDVFLKSQIKIEKNDVAWPLIVALVYIFVAVLPLKYLAGIIIYPLFFDEVGPTIGILIGNISICTLTFYSGFYVLRPKGKKI